MKRKTILFFVCLCLTMGSGISFADTYSEFFVFFDKENEAKLLSYLDTVGDNDFLSGALKRVGVLKLTNARAKVMTILSTYCPGDDDENMGSQEMSDRRDVFQMAVYTIGQIGDEDSVKYLSSIFTFLPEITYKQSVISALGDMSNSQPALETLNKIAPTISEYPLIISMLNAFLKHNSRKSIPALFMMAGNKNISSYTANMIRSVSTKISKEGKD